MAIQWYIKCDSGEYGPFSADQLKALANKGRITCNSHVRRHHDTFWTPATDVRGLLPGTAISATNTNLIKAPPLPPANPSQQSTSDATLNEQAKVSAGMPLYLWGIIGTACLILVSLLGYAIFLGIGGEISVGRSHKISDVSKQPTNSGAVDTIARVEPSIALIKGRLSSGSGFIVKPGILVTNKHVISGELSRHLKIHFPSAVPSRRGPFGAKLLYEDPEHDLAFLSIDSTLPPLDLATSYEFRRGQEVLVIGSPGVTDKLVLENAICRGIMSTQVSIEGKKYYQIGIATNPGNSGGPVLDSDGRVIGVVTLKASEREGLGFSIPIECLHSALGTISRITEQDIDLFRSQHRAKVVFLYVGVTGAFYKTGMGMYVKAMRESILAGSSAETGLNSIRSEVESKLTLLDEVFVDDLRKELAAISTDNNLPEDTRQRFVDLWTNYLEMKSYVQSPRGSYISYMKKFRELGDNHDRLSEGLALLLGVDPPK